MIYRPLEHRTSTSRKLPFFALAVVQNSWFSNRPICSFIFDIFLNKRTLTQKTKFLENLTETSFFLPFPVCRKQWIIRIQLVQLHSIIDNDC